MRCVWLSGRIDRWWIHDGRRGRSRPGDRHPRRVGHSVLGHRDCDELSRAAASAHDAEVVVDLSPDQLEAFVRELDANAFYVNVEGARTALAERRQFNVVETTRATKLDVIIRKDRAFSREEFARRQRVSLPFASPVSIVTPEDAILSKLEWAQRAADSERQLRDAAGVLELNPALDRQYIDRWAVELGVRGLWRRLAAQ